MNRRMTVARPLASKVLLAAVALGAPLILRTASYAQQGCPQNTPNNSTCPVTATTCIVNQQPGGVNCSGSVDTLSTGMFSCRSNPNQQTECIDDTTTALCKTTRPCIFNADLGCVGDPNTAQQSSLVVKRGNQCGQMPM